jgi:hypothetical protein
MALGLPAVAEGVTVNLSPPLAGWARRPPWRLNLWERRVKYLCLFSDRAA